VTSPSLTNNAAPELPGRWWFGAGRSPQGEKLSQEPHAKLGNFQTPNVGRMRAAMTICSGYGTAFGNSLSGAGCAARLGRLASEGLLFDMPGQITAVKPAPSRSPAWSKNIYR